ncbi:MAG TPA: M48 family metallopeptidase [bacterium]|jgi:heat shock protein HtpX|nr:M48 family metallopeptidase [bacterium]HNZ51564.1 M48 family metallopeptidase [bacterium]HOF79482.1 M48 family metallopeptidase [bacterium]HOH85247.1 M48 family metallopeptidase [bacterium]HOQ91961.1 M48 family metallopeptidase [bacterium]
MNFYQQVDSNRHKTWLLISLSASLLILVGFVFSQVNNNPIWLYIALAYAVISSFISYWWSDKIVLTISRAKEVQASDSPQLYRLIENLCITAGLPMPKIYVIDDSAPNAFATGRDSKHAAVAFTSGLLAKLDKAELEGVIAHELSHIGNRDILLATIVSVLVGTVVLLADWFARWSFWGGGRRRQDDQGAGQLQAILSIVAIILAILAPLFAQIIQMAISRRREFLADANSALLTRYPEGLIRALQKISADPEPLEAANRATAHLYFASPFHNKRGVSGLTKMFMSHPPVEERIAALRQINI